MLSETPMGQLPTLEVDGLTLCQSNAIGRLLANEFGKNRSYMYNITSNGNLKNNDAGGNANDQAFIGILYITYQNGVI